MVVRYEPDDPAWRVMPAALDGDAVPARLAFRWRCVAAVASVVSLVGIHLVAASALPGWALLPCWVVYPASSFIVTRHGSTKVWVPWVPSTARDGLVLPLLSAIAVMVVSESTRPGWAVYVGALTLVALSLGVAVSLAWRGIQPGPTGFQLEALELQRRRLGVLGLIEGSE